MNYGAVAAAVELRFYLIYAITNVTSGCCCEANPQSPSSPAQPSPAQSIARWFVNLHLAKKKHFAFHLRCGVCVCLERRTPRKFCVCCSENNKTSDSERIHSEWRRWTSCYVQIQLKQQYVKRIMACCELVSSSTFFSRFVLFFSLETRRWCGVSRCWSRWVCVCLCTRQSFATPQTRISWFSGFVCEYFNDQKFTTTMTAY